MRGKDRGDLIRVVGPVGCRVQYSTPLEFPRGQGREFRLHHAPLVMALLRPWVREEQVDRREAAVGDHLFQHLDCVVADDAQVFQFFGMDLLEQAADARSVHFYGDEVDLRMRGGNFGGGVAHARADLEHQRTSRGDLLAGEWNAVLWIQLCESSFLGRGCPALTQDVAANRPDDGSRHGVAQAAFGAIFPSVGELGVAE